MRIGGWTAAIAACAMLAFGSAQADTLEDWRKIADRVVAIYEQSSDKSEEYDAVTGDFDCQGLSLGSKQWPFQNGSIRKILTRLPAGVLESSIAATMPRHGATFLKAAKLAIARKNSEARLATLQLQRTQASGCKGPKGVALLPGVEAELKAWLSTPEVRAAQIAEEQAVSQVAVRLAACWADRIGGGRAPKFTEYLFFYDYLTQNGGAWVEDFILIDAFDKVDYRQYGKGEAELVAEKLSLIAQFYETDWSVAFAKGYLRDADKNAAVLRAAQAAGEVGESEVGLLMVKLFRGALGNTPFALPSMNRGVISLFGRGSVNGASYDIRRDLSSAGPLDAGAIPADRVCVRGG